MGKFEIDFDKLARKAELNKAKKVVQFYVGIAMIQIFIVCVCGLAVLFWPNKLTMFMLSVMTLMLAVVVIAICMTLKEYKHKARIEEDEA
jgi:hypothetical protein